MKYPTQIIANGELQYDMELEPDTINRVKDCMYELANGAIALIWTIDDVQAVDSSISDDEARAILQMIYRNHDANIGINWEVIEYYINEYKENNHELQI